MNALIDAVKLFARLTALYFWSFVVTFMIILWGILYMLFWRKK